MKVLLQRVARARVLVNGTTVGAIDRGYVLFLAVLQSDTQAEVTWLAEKVSKLRLFDGPDGVINDDSILDIGGAVLVVSQFTLAGQVVRGNRPDYTVAKAPQAARVLYEFFVCELRRLGVKNVTTGVFGASMQVELQNDGPVTLMLERA